MTKIIMKPLIMLIISNLNPKGLLLNHFCFLILLVGIIIPTSTFGQEITVEVGVTTIGLNEDFEVTVTVQGGILKTNSPFPVINGMDKTGTYTSKSMKLINGQISETQALTQRYRAPRKGVYFLRPFSITVNGEQVRHAGATIDVKGTSGSNNALDNFWGKNEETEYISVKDNAFFAITTHKPEVYIGEGYTVTMAFFVAKTNEAILRFEDWKVQISDIVKQIRPKNTLEESFNVAFMPGGEKVMLKGKEYRKYVLYQGVFYTSNPQTISIPSIPFKVVKLDIAVNSQSIYNQMKETSKTYYSDPISITIKDLPPHPLKNKVTVGNYILKEQIATKSLLTGQSVPYQFHIEGQGNLALIEKPSIPQTPNFDFYEPTISENLYRNNNTLYGTKDFNYYIIANEPGLYPMKDYFSYIYFNTEKEKYDTLSSQLTLSVTGESRKNASISEITNLGNFYDRINDENNDLRSRSEIKWEKYGINIIAILFVLVLGLSIWIGKKMHQRDLDRE